MPQGDWLTLMGVGGLFILLGLAAIIWGRREEKSYYDSLATRRADTREFLEHWPQRPQFVALKIGGWIAIAIGVAIVFWGAILRLWG